MTFEKRKLYNHEDSGKVFLYALLLPFVLSLVFSMVADQIALGMAVKPEVVTGSIWYIVAFSIASFGLYLGLYFVYTKTKNIEYSAIKLSFKTKWHTTLLMIAIGVVVLFGLQYFVGVFDNLLKAIGFPFEEGLSSINPTTFGEYALAVVILAILPAIGEELLFRGMIFNGLRERFKDWTAIFLSGLMFALMHTNLQQFVFLLL